MNIVVVGAGYAGTVAANRLAKKVPDARITVVNPRQEFVERVRLHEQLAGSGSAARPLGDMLADGITCHLGTVDKIGDGAVTLDDGRAFDFDHLFLAVGSTSTPLPGAIGIDSWEGAEQARTALDDLPADSAVTVIGGGLTGIETAAEIAESRPDLRVLLVGPELGASLSAGGRRKVERTLGRLGVRIVVDEVTEIVDGAVVLRTGGAQASALTLWAIVGSVPELAARSGLAVDGTGRALVDACLRSVSDDRIFAVGDCAAVPGTRMACATAAPQAMHAADTLARTIAGRTPKPFAMGYAGQALSLGRRDALVQATRLDDRPLPVSYAGRLAAFTKERIVRYAAWSARTGFAMAAPGRPR
ncbi:NAD(P)/FAD-dependent oxidoreductase [Nocardia rhizosphaerae]|uniref:NAD(P)/FAD-dependent oxidoreductase n=1 Tax=Nocardia rhizosphaerae TaxID=1691571 RepID=A0ABV8L4D4_9NOCA